MRLFQVSRHCSDTVHMVVTWMTLPHSDLGRDLEHCEGWLGCVWSAALTAFPIGTDPPTGLPITFPMSESIQTHY